MQLFTNTFASRGITANAANTTQGGNVTVANTTVTGNVNIDSVSTSGTVNSHTLTLTRYLLTVTTLQGIYRWSNIGTLETT